MIAYLADKESKSGGPPGVAGDSAGSTRPSRDGQVNPPPLRRVVFHSHPFATSVPCTEIRRNTWHKWHNFCTLNRVRNAGSAFHSTRVLIPKLNVEGSNPFARFGGDGWWGCGGGLVESSRTGVWWCPPRTQTMNLVVESTGLASVCGRGQFQHLRGSMFCGALAKCAWGNFGCDLLHWLTVWLRGDRVTCRARNGPGPPHAGICAHACRGVKKSAGTGWDPG